MQQNQAFEGLVRRFSRPEVLLAEFGTGIGFETLLNLSHGIDTALTRGFLGGLETMGLVSGAPISFIHGLRTINQNINAPATPHDRFTNATIQLIPSASFIGAVVNGARQYVEPTYRTFLDRLPLVSIPQFQDIPAYFTRLVDGAIIGAAIVTTPYLLYQGQRQGIYGRVGRAYLNINRRIFDFARDRVSNLYGQTWGRIAGGASVVGSNATTGGTIYGIGRLAGIF